MKKNEYYAPMCKLMLKTIILKFVFDCTIEKIDMAHHCHRFRKTGHKGKYFLFWIRKSVNIINII